MKFNKNTAYVLAHLQNDKRNVTDIAQLLGIDVRSVQRAFTRLSELGLLVRRGNANRPSYELQYTALMSFPIPDKLLEDDNRPTAHFHHNFLNWLESLPGNKLDDILNDPSQKYKLAGISKKELEYLTIELSWKSSALEGNTYTLLDTELLLKEGYRAKNKTDFETQMILNHKRAIDFIMEHPDLFKDDLEFRAVEELHRIIGYNLGIGPGIRKKLVRIGASKYEPLANPHQLREQATIILGIVNHCKSPFVRALLLFALIPYLQLFEDGNKRTGRILANAVLLHSIGRGFSLRKVDAKQLALAYLAFYEFNSLKELSKILQSELRS